MTTVTHHPDLWFEDGNIILVAGETGFCVHRGVLARKATVFDDMLNASSPADDEMVGIIPSVKLSDTPEDIALLLDTIYNGMK